MSCWVGERLGVRATVTATHPSLAPFAGAIEIGLRHNPNRAQLIVSRVLGKHIPVPVADVLCAARSLGELVRGACGGDTPVVIGFAETATGLGHGVASVSAADGGPAPYLHTTRRPVPPGARTVTFREEHSHATDHALAPLDDAALRGGSPLILVDDELSTGNTALNAIRVLQVAWPRRRYVLASLLDSRSAEQRAAAAEEVRALGADLVSVALLDGHLRLPADILERAERLRRRLPGAQRQAGVPVPVTSLDVTLPAGMSATAPGGWDRAREQACRQEMSRVAGLLPLAGNSRTLVLGDEEFMYLPQLLAAALGDQVRTSATTRSPAVVVDAPGYPLRTVLAFPSTEDGRRAAYAYNVAPSARDEPGNAPGFDDIVLCTDARESAHAAQLIVQLACSARSSVRVLTVREGSSPRQRGQASQRDTAAEAGPAC